MLEPNVISFIERHRICNFSVTQPDGTLHSAACHYASTPLGEIIILTENTTRKVKNLLDGKTAPAAVTIGFSEQEFMTWQASGNARVALKTETELKEIYERKFDTQLILEENSVFIIFTPVWHRYSELKSNPKVIIESRSDVLI